MKVFIMSFYKHSVLRVSIKKNTFFCHTGNNNFLFYFLLTNKSRYFISTVEAVFYKLLNFWVIIYTYLLILLPFYISIITHLFSTFSFIFQFGTSKTMNNA